MSNNNKSLDLYKEIVDVDTSIRIVGGPNNHGFITYDIKDEIDATEYETFTLEEFRSLIVTYRKADKDFLIAKVTTSDPNHEEAVYNFYYSAPDMNRILFRFESSKRLLHRMKVKNPLNNIYIVGPVYYYKIACNVVDEMIAEYYGMPSYNTTEFSPSNSRITDRIPTSDSNIQIAENNQSTNISYRSAEDYIGKVKEGTIKINIKNCPDKLIYEARFFATEDDFLLIADIRDYFKRNLLSDSDEFLYEINRARHDFVALLEDESESEDSDVHDWRRILNAHCTLAISMLIVCLLIGGGPTIAIIFFPVSILILLSFIFSITYVLCCRRSTFDTIAVESFSDEEAT